MRMTLDEKNYKVKVGDVLKGKRTGTLYDVTDYVLTKWPGHGIYSLVPRGTDEKRTIADFALHRKYDVYEKN
jgi:hypothetical protein